jgi:predicted AAA+ superfamily ATPase
MCNKLKKIKMENKLTIITGPKNSGKTLKAKEIALTFKENEVSWNLYPMNYISRMLNYWEAITKAATKLVVIDEIDDELFLFSMIMLFKHKKLANKKMNLILVCEKNIDQDKWYRITLLHNIDCEFINLK